MAKPALWGIALFIVLFLTLPGVKRSGKNNHNNTEMLKLKIDPEVLKVEFLGKNTEIYLKPNPFWDTRWNSEHLARWFGCDGTKEVLYGKGYVWRPKGIFSFLGKHWYMYWD